MNIKITYNWLLDYLDTKATPIQIQKYLSLCGPSVERVEKKGDDYIFDIEITSNRIDCASVYGIAREAASILTQFDIPAKLREAPQKFNINFTPIYHLNLINDSSICRRLMATVLDNLEITASSKLIAKRLELIGIRTINNAVDITNYVMVDLGYPAHVFDYDRIKTATLKIRNAEKGEKIISLENKCYLLSNEDVVVDDGTGRIIDLPGIIGAENSAVTPKTKRIIYFTNSINPKKIRRTSMRLGVRTYAAAINEKNPSPETAQTAFYYGLKLFSQIPKARVAAHLYDIYKEEFQPKVLPVDIADIERTIGINIPVNTATSILKSLGFKVQKMTKGRLLITIPHFRTTDIASVEDIIEEVSRIYGYERLPAVVDSIGTLEQPDDIKKRLIVEKSTKSLLKDIGLTEIYNYSMISAANLKIFGLSEKDHLRLKNSISADLEFLRTNLFPSLVGNIKHNEGKRDILEFFEIATVYQKRDGELPLEKRRLAIATNTTYYDLKGIVETLLDNLKLTPQFSIRSGDAAPYLSSKVQANIKIDDHLVGFIGELSPAILRVLSLKKPVFVTELDFDQLVLQFRTSISYKPINPYAIVKLDLTVDLTKVGSYEEVILNIKKSSPLLTDVTYLTLYQNKLSLRLYFSDSKKNITEQEALLELEKIKKAL